MPVSGLAAEGTMSGDALPAAIVIALTCFLCWFRTLILGLGRNRTARRSVYPREPSRVGESEPFARGLPAPLLADHRPSPAVQARPASLRVVAMQDDPARRRFWGNWVFLIPELSAKQAKKGRQKSELEKRKSGIDRGELTSAVKEKVGLLLPDSRMIYLAALWFSPGIRESLPQPNL